MKPGTALFVAALLWLFLGAAAFFADSIFVAWIIAGLCALPFIIFDFIALRFFTRGFSAARFISGALALGEKTAVKLLLKERGGKLFRARSVRLFDIYPDGFECDAFPVKLETKNKKNIAQKNARKKNDFANNSDFEIAVEYPLLPVERGAWEFKKTEFLYGSLLGFWKRKVAEQCVSAGRTFPDFKKIAGGGGLRAVLESAGLKEKRRRGQGMEFMSLREYQKGDAVRSIDWRATGRRRKFIVREYQEEQDQQVLFLLDSGYRLNRIEERNRWGAHFPELSSHTDAFDAAPPYAPNLRFSATPQTGGILRTQFDSALEASLLLSWVALKHGDGVALGVFGAEERWLPPRKGMSALSSIMRSLYDVKSAPSPSSLFSALENALSRLRRRTFIIMLSNFREEDGPSLSWILNRIRRRHLLLLVSLREPEAETIARRIPATAEESLETAAAYSYLAARKRLYKNWEHLGLLTLECTQAELSASLINRYLEVKRSGLL